MEIEAKLKKVKKKDINSIEEASEEIRDLINDEKFPDDIGKEILRKFKKLNVKFVAVRSSATAEDSSIASWAGELESYLNVTKKDLLKYVKNAGRRFLLPAPYFTALRKSWPTRKFQWRLLSKR